MKYKDKDTKEAETPIQVLDKSTQADKTDSIDSSLNSIDVDTSTDTDFSSMDEDLKSL